MKQVLFGIVPVLALTALATGCSGGNSSTSPFGSDPDFQSIQARMDKPDGTFTAAKASAVFASYANNQSGASSADVAGASGVTGTSSSSGGGSSTMSSFRSHSNGLKLLDDPASGATASCSDLASHKLTGSCACPAGGTFNYDFSEYEAAANSSAVADATIRVAMTQCTSASGDMVDGHEYVHAHVDRTNASAPNEALLLVLDVTARTAGVTHSLDVNELFTENAQGATVAIAVQVDDGWVVVQAAESTSGNASFSVKDRDGTWSCSVTNGAGTCTDPSGKSQAFTKS